MKVLQLCNKIPFPPNDGGSIAMVNCTSSMIKLGHSVSILAMDTNKHSFKKEAIPAGLEKKMSFHSVSVRTEIKLTHLLWNLLFSTLPYNAQRFLSEDFSRKLTRILSDTEFDVVQLEGFYLTPYIPLIRRHSKALISFRAHNIESEIWYRIYSNCNNIFKKLYLRILQKRLQRMERKMINNYDVIVPISERDASMFLKWKNTKPIHVSPTGILPDRFRKSISEKLPVKLFFIGSLDWIPNQEGIKWILENVWPKAKQLLPHLQFHIAGRNAPQWLVKELKLDKIHFHGEVDDAASFFDNHDLMIVPLFSGSGIRIKIIEAMARSKVVVTTPVGAEGLGIENGNQARIEENPEKFINAIHDLCTQENTYAEMSRNAFNYAFNNFSNDKITEQLLNFYKEQLA